MLITVFALAFLARFLFCVVAFPVVADRTGLNTGSDGYDRIARNLVAGQGFRFYPDYARTTLRMPLYPYLLAGIFGLFGDWLLAVQTVQSVFGGLSAALLAWLAYRSFGIKAAWIAGLAYAVYPGDLVACARYLVEPLAVLLLLLTVLSVQKLVARPTVMAAVLVGVFCGLMGQAKSSFALLLPIFLLYALLARATWHPSARSVVLATAIVLPFVLISLPWMWRGYRLTGQVFFPSTLGGHGLMDGYAVSSGLGTGKSVRDLLYEGRKRFRQIATENGIELHPRDQYSWTFRTAGDEYRMDQLLKAEFWRTCRADPWDHARRSALGLPRFWYLARNEKLTWISMALHGPLVLLALIGAVVAVRSGRREAWLWILLIAYFNVLNGVIDPLVRYAIPAVPFAILLASAFPAGRTARPAGSAPAPFPA